MRFTIQTDDGETYVIKDRGKMFASDVLAKQIGPVIRQITHR